MGYITNLQEETRRKPVPGYMEQPKNKVVQGNFPVQDRYKKPFILKINTFLAVCLLGAIILSMVSYLGVIAKEGRIKELHISANKIIYENIELQNKVDSLKSFYSIGDKVQKINFLKKADKVLEVKTKSAPSVSLIPAKTANNKITTVPGF